MTSDQTRLRLDLALVAHGLAATRSRARDLIARGLVTVEGQRCDKPALMVASGARLAIAGEDAGLVSRGGVKLKAALEAFGFDPAGRVALDVGASTGGFTQALLERGATRVYAVDVGHGQLHGMLAADPRVVALEGTDARTLSATLIPEAPGAVVADVSFISLTKALPAALALAAPGAWLVALVKPQFEAGPQHVGKGGIVRDEAARDAAVASVSAWIGAQPGWRATGLTRSPITGGSGNVEYLLGAFRHD